MAPENLFVSRRADIRLAAWAVIGKRRSEKNSYRIHSVITDTGRLTADHQNRDIQFVAHRIDRVAEDQVLDAAMSMRAP